MPPATPNRPITGKIKNHLAASPRFIKLRPHLPEISAESPEDSRNLNCSLIISFHQERTAPLRRCRQFEDGTPKVEHLVVVNFVSEAETLDAGQD
ncbi:hypothetical protein Zmor_012770 [Zophobas morio]|uniref:Uncharacterized protein n=1 Tax=Zophobas morio TaxID=2755281 RepID=A0AA38IC15_9CUCU|nr:hypothetical protein Zmor_012770 [Zophobas morio]